MSLEKKKKPNNPANELLIRHPNLETSDALVKSSLKEGELGEDEIFVMGKVVRQTGRKWRIEIAPGSPTVAKYESTKKRLNLSDSPTIEQMRTGSVFPGCHLVSGGSFVWANIRGEQRLILFRRIPIEKDPSVVIGLLTGPAGRCGELLSQTCRKETNEEMIVLSSRETIGFFRDGDNPEEIINQKIGQAKRKLKEAERLQEHLLGQQDNEDIREKIEENSRMINILRKIKTEDDVKMLNIKQLARSNENLDQISMTIAGEEIDLIENGIGVIDPRTNTFEVREVLRLPDDIAVEFVVDGEPQTREVVLVGSLQEIETSEIVPALDYYRNRLSFNINR